jgi:uncharacterized membrane protein
LAHLQKALYYLIFFLVLTGGFVFNIGPAKIEIGEVNPYAWAFLLLIGIDLYRGKESLGLKLSMGFVEKIATLGDPKRRALFILLAFTLGCILAHLFKHWILKTNALDATYVNQPLHFPFGDPILKCDLCRGDTRFSEHLGATLLLIAPLTQLLKSEEFIILLQNLFVFGGIALLCFFGPIKNKVNLLPVALLLILSHKTMKYFTVWDFKEDHLGFFFLCVALLSLYRKSLVWFAVSVALSLASKEVTPFIFPMLLIPILFDKNLELKASQKFSFSVWTLLLSAAWYIYGVGTLMPAFAAPTSSSVGHFARLGVPGDSLTEILLNLLTNPSVWWMIITEKLAKLTVGKYLLVLLIPFAISLRKSWPWLLASSPMIAINVLSKFDTQRTLRFHYEAFLLPFLIMGLLIALKDYEIKKDLKRLTFALLLALCVSDRWPGHFMWRYWPGVSDLQNISFLNSISDVTTEPNYLVASDQMHAQTSHLKYLLSVSFNHLAKAPPENRVSSFLNRNPQRAPVSLDRFLLNLEDENQLALYESLKVLELDTSKVSKDQRLVYLKLKQPLEPALHQSD